MVFLRSSQKGHAGMSERQNGETITSTMVSRLCVLRPYRVEEARSTLRVEAHKNVRKTSCG